MWTGYTQACHQGFTHSSCVHFIAYTGKATTVGGDATAAVLTGTGSTVSRRNALVAKPLVDAHHAVPAGGTSTHVRATATDFHRLVRPRNGDCDSSMVTRERQELAIVLYIWKAAIKTWNKTKKKLLVYNIIIIIITTLMKKQLIIIYTGMVIRINKMNINDN